MNKIFLVFTLFASLGLTGCKTFPSTDIKTDNSSVQSKSIVVLEVSRPLRSYLFGDLKLGVFNHWARVDEKYFTSEPLTYDFTNQSILSGRSSGLSAHMVEPGLYVLEYLQFTEGNRIISTVNRGFSKKFGQPTRISFVVRPGENIYIGDILIGGDEFITVNDNYDAAQKYFKENYPQIRSPLVKKLAS